MTIVELNTPAELLSAEQAAYNRGFADGMHKANNAAQPIVSDLELRNAKMIELLKEAIEAGHTPSF